jgi:hypothetical protein
MPVKTERRRKKEDRDRRPRKSKGEGGKKYDEILHLAHTHSNDNY